MVDALDIRVPSRSRAITNAFDVMEMDSLLKACPQVVQISSMSLFPCLYWDKLHPEIVWCYSC